MKMKECLYLIKIKKYAKIKKRIKIKGKTNTLIIQNKKKKCPNRYSKPGPRQCECHVITN